MTDLDQNLPLGIDRYTMLGAANNVGDSLVVQTLYRYWLSCQWDNYMQRENYATRLRFNIIRRLISSGDVFASSSIP